MKLFSNTKENTLTCILSLLNVRYTDKYANSYFNEHPHKYDLFGLSKMLNHYGVNNKGIRIAHKEDIHFLEAPFIAHIGSDFVTVKKITEKKICYYWRQKELTVSVEDFFDIWSGVVLVVEADEASAEPDYQKHKKEELATSVPKVLLALATIVLIGLGCHQSRILQHWGLCLSLILNLLGVFIGFILVKKQINIHSSMADKICSLFSSSDCNNVLSSSASKFFGIIGWSELGLSYFLSNTFLILFVPELLPYQAFLNILGLVYSFWSIWYQKYRAKAWCPLCLMVQLLFWSLFLTSLLAGFIRMPDFTVSDILSIALIYGIPFLLIHLLLPNQVAGKKLTTVTQQFNSLKANDKVFAGLLKDQTFYPIDEDFPTIIFGNPDAKHTITIFSNPHCGPCARMHSRMEKLLKDTNNRFRIQYILSSFESSLDSSCEFFLYANRKYSVEERNRIYDEWFEGGKYDKEKFFKSHSFLSDINFVSKEYQKHLDWKEQTKLRATPTILFDGYELPEMYFQQVDKLAFFTDLEFEPK